MRDEDSVHLDCFGCADGNDRCLDQKELGALSFCQFTKNILCFVDMTICKFCKTELLFWFHI